MPETRDLDAASRVEMLEAAKEIRECYRVLEKAGLNIVGEVLRGQGEFVELEHYPNDDVLDNETHSQYYYHAHRPESGEHGHFHTFIRAGGMPPGLQAQSELLLSEPWPEGDDAIGHLIGISMDAWGYPIGLFATNRWVTGETWYRAEDAINMLGQFKIDHAGPSWPVNRWISAMLVLFGKHAEVLLRHRDAVINSWKESHPDSDVLEDRGLDITGYIPISVDDWAKQLELEA
ncbi:MAG: hypothetical protein ABFS08_01195 [Pseudomonadota bacterium]